jgi:hypothetical protein
MKLRTMIVTWTVLVGCQVVGQAKAEVPPFEPEALKREATDIVIGDVRKVDATDQVTSPGHVDILYDLEIQVISCEKGDRWHRGDTAHAKCWHLKIRPNAWAGPTGQWYVPKPGQRIRAYLNGQNLISPNGIDIIIAHQFDLHDSSGEDAERKPAFSWPIIVLAGGISLLTGFAAGICYPKLKNRPIMSTVNK